MSVTERVSWSFHVTWTEIVADDSTADNKRRLSYGFTREYTDESTAHAQRAWHERNPDQWLPTAGMAFDVSEMFKRTEYLETKD